MSKRTRRGALRRCAHEEWRDWANLPTVLIVDIAGRLLRYDVAEYLRLRAACKEWRECTSWGGDLDSRFRPRRWIMLSNTTDGARRRFLNLATGSCARVDLPELSSHRLETTTEGFLVLRDKATDAIRLLNPLTRSLIDLPSAVTLDPLSIVHAGISDETSPATVVLFLRRIGCWNIAYAKPGDKRWALMEDESLGWERLPSARILREGDAIKSVKFKSAATLRGRVYFPTYEGNVLTVRLRPKPRLVPVIKNQASDAQLRGNYVTSYLVPADDDGDKLLMVRDYGDLYHLSETEQRSIKRRKNTDVIKLEICSKPRRVYLWRLIQVFRVNIARRRLVRAADTGRRALFVGDVACFSLSADKFPSVAGDAVYLGLNSSVSIGVGVRHLRDRTFEPPYEFKLESGRRALLYGWKIPENDPVVPLARPCSLPEYLICCTGLTGGIKD